MTNDRLHPKLQRTLNDLLRYGMVDEWIDAIEQLTPEQLAQLEQKER
jgi:predicted Zn-dependent peptidase